MLHETIRADLATAVPSLTDEQIGKIADALEAHAARERTWEDYLADGRRWARSHARGPLSRGSLASHARAYADVNCPARIKDAHFAAVKAARDAEFAK